MRKILSILLIFGCVLGLLGCQSRGTSPQNPVTVYYRRAEVTYGSQDSVIVPMVLDAVDHQGDYTNFLNQYLMNTKEDGFAQTFPNGTRVVSFQQQALTAQIVLNDNFAVLSGIDLTIASVCLTQTILSLTGCQEVIISAESVLLGGHKYITLSKDSCLMLDSSGNSGS